MLTSLFSLFYVTGECHRFLHRGWAVLGHETTTAPTAKPDSRCRRHLPLNEVSNAPLLAPAPVKELLMNRSIPQLTELEKEEVPPIQKQSKINFISDKDVAIFCSTKRTRAWTPRNYSIRLMTDIIQWTQRTYKQTLLYSSFVVHVIVTDYNHICCFI